MPLSTAEMVFAGLSSLAEDAMLLLLMCLLRKSSMFFSSSKYSSRGPADTMGISASFSSSSSVSPYGSSWPLNLLFCYGADIFFNLSLSLVALFFVAERLVLGKSGVSLTVGFCSFDGLESIGLSFCYLMWGAGFLGLSFSTFFFLTFSKIVSNSNFIFVTYSC